MYRRSPIEPLRGLVDEGEGTSMERPVMNPSFTYEAPPPPKKKRERFALIRKTGRLIVRVLMSHPFGHRHFRNEDGSRLSRFIRGFTYRLAFVPVLLVAFLTCMVLAATHPGRSAQGADPMTFGVYYDPVNFIAEDGARLEGWLVPVLDAKRVLEERDLVVGKRYAAVVLVHDFAGSRQQLLPLVQPLHEAGFVVLGINSRGAASL